MAGSAKMPHQRGRLEQAAGGGTGEDTEEVSRLWWWGEARRKVGMRLRYHDVIVVFL